MITNLIEMKSMRDKIFLDTNLWIYLYAKYPIEKSQEVENIINNNSQNIQMSTQVLGEIFHVLTRKKLTKQQEATAIVNDLINFFPIQGIDSQTVLYALRIHADYKYSYWDSLIIATALTANCSVLYSEDMQHHQLIDNQLHILNPFV